MLLISRTFMTLSKMLEGLSAKAIEPIFAKGLEYVWIHLDHYIENIRQFTQAVFKNFTRIAIKHYKEGIKSKLKLFIHSW